MGEIIVTREEAGDGRGRYVALVDGVESELTYSRAERNGQKLLIASHTGVPSKLSGRGVGLALVAKAVEDARAGNVLIVPACSFVRVMFTRHKHWRDVEAGTETRA